jgi:hypothetical protein
MCSGNSGRFLWECSQYSSLKYLFSSRIQRLLGLASECLIDECLTMVFKSNKVSFYLGEKNWVALSDKIAT